jgi:amino acid efflux transporter
VHPAVRRGLGLAEGVLGAGLLLLPPVVAGVAGSAAPAAWGVQLLIGASVAAALGSLAAYRRRPGSLPELLADVLGPAARRALVAVYLVGFTVGQAALALAAGRLLLAALDVRPAGAAPVLVGVGVLALGAAGARLPWGTGARRARLAVVLAVALVGCARPELFGAAGLLDLPGGDRAAVAVFLLFFASVGWESAGRSPGPGRVLPATAVALLAVGLVQLSLALLLDTRAATAGTDPGWSLRVVAAAGSVTLTAFVATNLAAASRFATELGAPGGGRTVLGPAVAAACALVAAAAAGWGLTALLLVPSAATCTGYLLGCLAVARGGSKKYQWSAAALAALLILVAITAVISADGGPPSFPGNV